MTDLGARAYASRRALYLAVGLDLADKVRAPDDRFACAVAQLGRDDPVARAAIADRNALAALAEPVVRAVAAGYARAVPRLARAEAEQEGRLGALKAAEMWTPAGGANFPGYARSWVRQRVSRLADRSRPVTLPERSRIAGERVEVLEVDPRRHGGPNALEELEEFAEREGRLDWIDRVVAELPALEREALHVAHGDRSMTSTADALGVRQRDLRVAARRALDRLRRLAGVQAPEEQLELLGVVPER